MSDIEEQLTNPFLIADELNNLLEDGKEYVNSIIEKHAHGESFAIEEDTAKIIIQKINAINDSDTKKQLIETTLLYENLVQSVPLLISANNARLLQLLQDKYQ